LVVLHGALSRTILSFWPSGLAPAREEYGAPLTEVDSEERTLPAINSFRRGGFRIYRRGRGGGVIALLIRLNNIPVLIGRGINYINKVECFLYYKKKYYLNIYLNNRGNF
jgi:hypothetical protein